MKVVSSQVLYEGKLKAVREIVEKQDGKRFTHETVYHPGAAVVLPVPDTGELILV